MVKVVLPAPEKPLNVTTGSPTLSGPAQQSLSSATTRPRLRSASQVSLMGVRFQVCGAASTKHPAAKQSSARPSGAVCRGSTVALLVTRAPAASSCACVTPFISPPAEVPRGCAASGMARGCIGEAPAQFTRHAVRGRVTVHRGRRQGPVRRAPQLVDHRQHVGAVEGHVAGHVERVAGKQLVVETDMPGAARAGDRIAQAAEQTELPIRLIETAEVELDVEVVIFVAFPTIYKGKEGFERRHTRRLRGWRRRLQGLSGGDQVGEETVDRRVAFAGDAKVEALEDMAAAG